MLQLALTLAAGLVGYLVSRNFVRNRLRFVDAVQSTWFPLIAGAIAFVFAWPTAFLPLVTVTPAVLFGIGTGLGTASGARHIRRNETIRRRLVP
jgi:hypothetical protein